MTKGRTMNRSLTPLRVALLAIGALAAIAVVGGCSHKVTQVDPGFTTLEGRINPDTRLVTWIDRGARGYTFGDFGSPDDRSDDILLSTFDANVGVPGTVHVQLLDRTPASGFDFYRRQPNGGLMRMTDYSIPAALKWLPSEWELYQIADTSPLPGQDGDYVARGLLGGVAGVSSPLSNTNPAQGADVQQSLHFTSERLQPDSSLTIGWTTDARAAGYWLEIVPFGSIAAHAVPISDLNEALPVLARAGSIKTKLAWVPASAVPGPTAIWRTGAGEASLVGADSLVSNPFHKNVLYFVRVCAVDAQGRVINRLECDYLVDRSDVLDPVNGTIYTLSPLGGVVLGSFVIVPGPPPIDFARGFVTWDRVPHSAPARSSPGSPAASVLAPRVIPAR
jgi:hypothetical protein